MRFNLCRTLCFLYLKLVTELIQYMGNDFEIGSLEATALLAGLRDTKTLFFKLV